MSIKNILEVKNLSVLFRNNVSVSQISFTIKKNEILGIVGESGSGKSVTSLAIMGLLPRKIATIIGSIIFDGKEISHFTDAQFQQIRAEEIGMIFQEPMSALNPTMKCGKQVVEVLQNHFKINRNDAKNKVLALFEKVKLPNPERIFNAYPHQLSGGQMQRVVIAIAIACEPKLLIADEPTTALDVTVQKEIVELLLDLQKQNQMAIIFISHDLNLVSQIANRTLVMYKGKPVELQSTEKLFQHPKEIYTKALIASKPNDDFRLKKLPTVTDFLNNTVSYEIITPHQRKESHSKLYSKAPILRIENISKSYFDAIGWFSKRETKAVNNVTFDVYEGETLGIVGESGCGKSTLGALILNLISPTEGAIFYKGKNILEYSTQEKQQYRREVQLIFQDPYASLNPKITIGQAILEAMIVHNLYDNNKQRKQEVFKLLENVGLESHHYNRYPHEFSGGQRQRVNIARSIALNPKVLVCDESVSALDVSVQAQVINLLNNLQQKYGFTCIFISHDLSVVKYISDHMVVMKNGKVVDFGEADYLYAYSNNPYTKNLIASVPKIKC